MISFFSILFYSIWLREKNQHNQRRPEKDLGKYIIDSYQNNKDWSIFKLNRIKIKMLCFKSKHI